MLHLLCTWFLLLLHQLHHRSPVLEVGTPVLKGQKWAFLPKMFLANISILTSTKCVCPSCTALVTTWVFHLGHGVLMYLRALKKPCWESRLFMDSFSTCGSSLLTLYIAQQWSAWRPHTHGETNINCQNYSLLEIAAAAKSLQSCPTLCDPIDCSPWGYPVPGTLQARALEWVAISFSNAWKWKVKMKTLSCVWLSVPFSRQEYWSGLPLPSPKLFPQHLDKWS